MQRLTVLLSVMLMLLLSALPAFASEGDPLANSILLPGTVGWAMFGLAILMMILFILWTRRGPN